MTLVLPQDTPSRSSNAAFNRSFIVLVGKHRAGKITARGSSRTLLLPRDTHHRTFQRPPTPSSRHRRASALTILLRRGTYCCFSTWPPGKVPQASRSPKWTDLVCRL